MLDIKQFCEASGLRMGDLVLGIAPSPKHRVLMSSYLLQLWRGHDAVREMMLTDIRSALDKQLMESAADLLQVLRQFLVDFPEARLSFAIAAHQD